MTTAHDQEDRLNDLVDMFVEDFCQSCLDLLDPNDLLYLNRRLHKRLTLALHEEMRFICTHLCPVRYVKRPVSPGKPSTR